MSPAYSWRRLVLPVAAGALLCWMAVGLYRELSYSPPRIAIHNRSSAILRAIQVSGGGFSMSVPDLPAGERVRVVARIPRGENSLVISFDTRSGRRSQNLGYVDDHGYYCLDVSVGPGYDVTVSGGAQPFALW